MQRMLVLDLQLYFWCVWHRITSDVDTSTDSRIGHALRQRIVIGASNQFTQRCFWRVGKLKLYSVIFAQLGSNFRFKASNFGAFGIACGKRVRAIRIGYWSTELISLEIFEEQCIVDFNGTIKQRVFAADFIVVKGLWIVSPSTVLQSA